MMNALDTNTVDALKHINIHHAQKVGAVALVKYSITYLIAFNLLID